MADFAVRVENLSKQYRIGERERYKALRDTLTDVLYFPFRAAASVFNGRRSVNGGKPPDDQIWALKDVSFEVKHGEVVGIIGRNGAGKSTLLKILSRITEPTDGYADIYGRVGSLLEVGTGFHPELTGRENIYLNGAFLGMKKAEIKRKFDEIVAFAEVEKFIDTPVKRYSSGMYMRLAFAVAAHLEPEILLVDEVLSVGDIAFQKKCLGKMGQVAKEGRTVFFVSHQMNQIRRLCSRVIWVDSGGVLMDGDTAGVVGAYESASSGEGRREDPPEASKVKARFLGWGIVDSSTDAPYILTSLGPVTIKFAVQINKPVHGGHHGIALYNTDGQLLWGWATNDLRLKEGVCEFQYTFPMLPLRPGAYCWKVSLYDEWGLLDSWYCVPEMQVATENYQHYRDEWSGFLNLPSRFVVEGKG